MGFGARTVFYNSNMYVVRGSQDLFRKLNCVVHMNCGIGKPRTVIQTPRGAHGAKQILHGCTRGCQLGTSGWKIQQPEPTNGPAIRRLPWRSRVSLDGPWALARLYMYIYIYIYIYTHACWIVLDKMWRARPLKTIGKQEEINMKSIGIL